MIRDRVKMTEVSCRCAGGIGGRQSPLRGRPGPACEGAAAGVGRRMARRPMRVFWTRVRGMGRRLKMAGGRGRSGAARYYDIPLGRICLDEGRRFQRIVRAGATSVQAGPDQDNLEEIRVEWIPSADQRRAGAAGSSSQVQRPAAHVDGKPGCSGCRRAVAVSVVKTGRRRQHAVVNKRTGLLHSCTDTGAFAFWPRTCAAAAGACVCQTQRKFEIGKTHHCRCTPDMSSACLPPSAPVHLRACAPPSADACGSTLVDVLLIAGRRHAVSVCLMCTRAAKEPGLRRTRQRNG